MANRLEHRLVAAANADLRRHRFAAPVDVLIGLGWLSNEHAEAWRRRRVPYLEQVTEASLGKLSSALRILQSWAQSEGLQPRETIYVSWTPSRHRLRFTKTGEENLERLPDALDLTRLIEADQQRKAEAAARRAVLLADELEAVSRAAFLAHRMTAEDPGSDPGLPPELRATVDQAADDWPGGAGALVTAIADAAPDTFVLLAGPLSQHPDPAVALAARRAAPEAGQSRRPAPEGNTRSWSARPRKGRRRRQR